MDSLTPRQEAVLEFVSGFIQKRGIPPTVREIQEHFGFESTNAVTDHLETLERKGCLRRRRGISRGIEVLSKSVSCHPGVVSVPILGEIAAGRPILAEENIEGYLHLDKTLIRGDSPFRAVPILEKKFNGGDGYFLLRVRGDSMKGAGIHDRDLVLVKKQERAERGDIVAAYLNGEATVKHFYPRRNVVELRPANPSYSPIRITKEKHPDFRILGKVRAVLRVF